MAKKEKLKALEVETPVRLPDFQTQILKGNFGVILSETDGKLEIKFAGVDKIYTKEDLYKFQSIFDDAILNLEKSNLIDSSGIYKEDCDCECECNDGPCYCCE